MKNSKIFGSVCLPPEDDYVAYETYMKAAIVCSYENGDKLLSVLFPAGGAEDNEIHLHPISARKIEVTAGSGAYIHFDGTKMVSQPLVVGDVVDMPANVAHTFFAGVQGMEVLSLHIPYVELSSRFCLVPVSEAFAKKYDVHNFLEMVKEELWKI